MANDAELLVEIRDLLLVLAEPALAKRDEKFRAAIRAIAGKGEKNRKAVQLMNGSRTQAIIAKESGIDSSNLSKLVKSLTNDKLIAADEKHPKLLVTLPQGFFDTSGAADE